MKLSNLSDTCKRKKGRRIGRGMGSKRGKTCGRGNKGDKSRQGYKYRFAHEGGQLPLFKKVPTRGFTNGRFTSEVFAINLGTIDKLFNDGDVVSLGSLQERGFAPRRVPGGLKVLSHGELKKKVTIEAVAYSATAEEKLNKAGIKYEQVLLGKQA